MRNLLFGLLFLAVGCTQPSSDETSKAKTDEGVDETTLNTPFSRSKTRDTTLFISHTVRDYDTWKAAFDLAQPVREKHGIKALNVYREMTDSSLALVYTRVTDLDAARDYITSDKLIQSMEVAGVIGAMDLYWMSNQLDYAKPITDSILMFMSFKVLSYDRWENAFLDDFREDANHDFQVRNVMRGIEEPGQVAMIFAVNDPDYVAKMEKNNAFRAKMLAAGVISYPVTYKLLNMPL
ncbi:MAG: hypothetical protein Salg2KO_14410 [Salibacteraceae bacterium]